MTGEITLSGNVLPIGGIKEKTLAAKRAGVKDIILPAENQQNVEEDLTPEQLQGINVHYVKTIDEVLEIALPIEPRRKKSRTLKSAPKCCTKHPRSKRRLMPGHEFSRAVSNRNKEGAFASVLRAANRSPFFFARKIEPRPPPRSWPIVICRQHPRFCKLPLRTC